MQHRRMRGFARLAPDDRLLALRALALLPLISLSISLLGLLRVVAVLKRLSAASSPTLEAEEFVAARRVARIVGKAARHAGSHGSCLRASVVLWHLLAARGISSELRIGVRKPSESSLDAHAWVEVQGQPVNDDPDVSVRYLPLPGLSEALKIS